MSKKRTKLNLDIEDWCHQVKETDLVIFEKFAETSNRSKEKEDLEEEDEDGPIGEMKFQSVALYQTPYGHVKIPEFCDITKHFKLWTMYTRNPITDKLRNSIDNMSGVETFEVFTPYRARLGICPLYKDGSVLHQIKTAIENLNLNENQPDTN